MTRTAASLAVLMLVASTATACAASAVQTCVDWVSYADAQAMYDDAVLVVAGTPGPADGQLRLFSGPGDRHSIAIDEVYKGDFDGGELWAASHRDYCVAEPPQPAEDPIPTGSRVLLFLRPASEDPTADAVPADLDEVAAWSTLTSLDGVLPFPEGAELPFEPEP
jgi:hypothetical protein